MQSLSDAGTVQPCGVAFAASGVLVDRLRATMLPVPLGSTVRTAVSAVQSAWSALDANMTVAGVQAAAACSQPCLMLAMAV